MVKIKQHIYEVEGAEGHPNAHFTKSLHVESQLLGAECRLNSAQIS